MTVVAASLTDADLDATAAFALGREALDWLRARPGRTGLVVGADGTPTVFGAPGSCVRERAMARPQAHDPLPSE